MKFIARAFPAIVLTFLLVIQARVAESADFTWDGGGTDDNLTTDANWDGDVAPTAGDTLIFTGGTRLTPTNDFASGTAFDRLTFDDSGSAAGDFILSGNALELTLATATISVNTAAASTQTINAALQLNGNHDIDTSADAVLILAGEITSSSTGEIEFNKGSTSAALDEGTIRITANNSYTSDSVIAGGTVVITHENALGVGNIILDDDSNFEPLLSIDTTSGNMVIDNEIIFADEGTVKMIQVTGGNQVNFTGNISLNDADTDDGSFMVESGSTLVFDNTISGVGIFNVDGDRSFDGRVLTGGGTVILKVANSYTGGTLHESGVLRLENSGALGSGDITVDRDGDESIIELANGITIANNATFVDETTNKTLRLEEGTGQTATWSGNILVEENTNLLFNLDANSSGGDNDQTQVLEITGDITSIAGAGLELTGDGVVRLAGNNNISGNIDINNNGSILRAGSNNAVGTANVILGTSNTRFQLENGVTLTGGNLIAQTVGESKFLELIDTSPGAAETATYGGNIEIQETNTDDFEVNAVGAEDTLTLAGDITGTVGGINMNGPGTVVFTGTNNGYTGITDVEDGTLLVNSNTGTGDVFVRSGATLGGSGTVSGNLSVRNGGTHAAGIPNSSTPTSTQTLAANAEYLSGATLAWDLIANSSATPGTEFDQWNATGNVEFAGGTLVTLDFNGTGTDGSVLWSNSFWTTDQEWTMMNVSGTLTDNGISITTENWLDSGGNGFDTAFNGGAIGSFALDTSSGVLVLKFTTAVPEPGTYAIMGFGLAASGWWVRRRRKQASEENG